MYVCKAGGSIDDLTYTIRTRCADGISLTWRQKRHGKPLIFVQNFGEQRSRSAAGSAL